MRCRRRKQIAAPAPSLGGAEPTGYLPRCAEWQAEIEARVFKGEQDLDMLESIFMRKTGSLPAVLEGHRQIGLIGPSFRFLKVLTRFVVAQNDSH